MYFFTHFYLIERWLSDVNMTGVYERPEEAIKQSEKQCADMRSVDIGIGGKDNLVITEFGNIKRVPYRCAEGDHQIFNLLGGEHLVEPRALDI